MEQDILEGNKLIAEFMGLRYKINGHPAAYWVQNSRKMSRLYYNSSWDWLMPVVEKINKSGVYDVIIYRTTCHINDQNEMLVEKCMNTTLIDTVWRSVVSFLNEFGAEFPVVENFKLVHILKQNQNAAATPPAVE